MQRTQTALLAAALAMALTAPALAKTETIKGLTCWTLGCANCGGGSLCW